MRTQTHNNNKNVFNVLWGTDFRWVKKPKLEHKWFFPGNKHAWLLICCNFLLSLVKTAITYLFHIPPSTDAPQSVHVPSTKRAVHAGPRVPALGCEAGQVCSPHAALLAAFVSHGCCSATVPRQWCAGPHFQPCPLLKANAASCSSAKRGAGLARQREDG